MRPKGERRWRRGRREGKNAECCSFLLGRRKAKRRDLTLRAQTRAPFASTHGSSPHCVPNGTDKCYFCLLIIGQRSCAVLSHFACTAPTRVVGRRGFGALSPVATGSQNWYMPVLWASLPIIRERTLWTGEEAVASAPKDDANGLCYFARP